jgi:hypothetical protein
MPTPPRPTAYAEKIREFLAGAADKVENPNFEGKKLGNSPTLL